MRASVFYGFAGNGHLSIAFKSYAYGLYGNLDPDLENVRQAGDNATRWLLQYCGEYLDRPWDIPGHYRHLAEIHVEGAGRKLESEQRVDFWAFSSFVKMLELDHVSERLDDLVPDKGSAMLWIVTFDSRWDFVLVHEVEFKQRLQADNGNYMRSRQSSKDE